MRYVCSVLFFLLFSLSLVASPWPRQKGAAYLKLYEWWLRFDQHYTSTGELDPNATLGLYNTTLYAEYGLTDRLTGIVNLPLLSRSTINAQISGTRGNVITPGDAINGIGDADLALRYALNKPGSAVPISATLTLGIPLGEDAGGEQGNLQTGDGEFNQMLSIAAGKSLGANAFLAANVGFNNRTQGFSDEFRYGLEGGYAFVGRKLWLIGRLTGSKSLLNGDTAATTSSTSIFSNNAEFLSLGGEVNYYLTPKLGLSAGAATALSGRVIAAAPVFSAGVFLDLNR
ncbi:hypothetical protein QWY85_00325 [Neolewinella lacunae]|uniref:Transporter n=1 Tax=Neolewinella lacunae TaxID=1517758 RepID=A0A923PJT8_9BACT|nr:hypothetical protein [Neolewinella lacunae]MBC6995370.1 hypothetical protein [Neolewinella lacunae]MDN3633082.1 hypothetical protein [Neolewinella lacunae]